MNAAHALQEARAGRAVRARVLAFRTADAALLARVEDECRTLRIPSYDDAERTYRSTVIHYAAQHGARAVYDEIEDAWTALKTKFPQHVGEFERWRKDITPLHRRQEAIWEHAAYLLGLFVARREFPRLGGGVLRRRAKHRVSWSKPSCSRRSGTSTALRNLSTWKMTT